MIVSLENVNFKYVDRPILQDVSFVVNEREKWGVVGLNGSGKSTFLKILSALQKPDSGSVTLLKKYSISYCPQKDDFDESKTLYQTIKGATEDKNVEDYQIKNILNRFDLNEYDQPVSLLSGGQRKRLSLAIALITPADLYLLDEPTNHLDQDMIVWLEDFLTNMNKALVMVTHDRYFLSRITDHMVEIDQGKIYCYQGNYADYLEQREIRYQQALASERKRQNFLRTEIEWIRAGVQARGTKSKDRIARYEAVAAQQGPSVREKLNLSSAASRLGGKVIEIYDLAGGYQQPALFEHFNDNILRDDRIGIIGNNGCGKTTLLKTIIGQLAPLEGRVEIGETVRIGYFAQSNAVMNPQDRVIDYLKQFGEVVETADYEKITASQMLERFLFSKDDQYNPISKCSGGELRRLYLCSILMQAPNVLVLDEPTNDFDTDTLTILEDYLETFQGAVIAVSHDRYFLDKAANRLWAFEDGKIENVLMDYSTYLSERHKPAAENKKPVEKGEKKQREFVAPANKVVMSTREKRQLEKLEESLPQLEKQIKELEDSLGNLSDYKEIIDISNQLQALKDEYEESELLWLELSEKKEQAANG